MKSSQLCEELYRDGIPKVTCIDISAVAVEKMNQPKDTKMPSCCVINQHAHLVVEMIYINLLACQTHKLQACYVAFWDEITLATQSHNDRISEDHIISKWRIVVVRELPFLDQRLNDS